MCLETEPQGRVGPGYGQLRCLGGDMETLRQRPEPQADDDDEGRHVGAGL